jgi:hypothetical protein
MYHDSANFLIARFPNRSSTGPHHQPPSERADRDDGDDDPEVLDPSRADRDHRHRDGADGANRDHDHHRDHSVWVVLTDTPDRGRRYARRHLFPKRTPYLSSI